MTLPLATVPGMDVDETPTGFVTPLGPIPGRVYDFFLHSGPVLALAVGAVLRAQQYLFRPSLELDEALLALNVVGRSYAALTQPLDIQQAAPVGFLWIQRSVVNVLGNNEYALRLFPFLCGLASLWLFYRLARRVLPHRVVPIATTLFALSPAAISFSIEAKQYAIDVFCALLVMNWGHGLLRAERPTTRSFIGFAVLGASLVWLSFPIVFVLAGVGSTALLTYLWERRRREAGWLLVAGSAWVAGYAWSWRYAKRAVDVHPGFVDFWEAGLAPRDGSIWERARWLGERGLDVMADPLGLTLTGLGLGLCAVGALWMIGRKRGSDLLVLISPIPFLLLAALLRLYPAQGRLVLFLLPVLLIILASATAPPWPRFRRTGAVVLVAALALAVFPPTRATARMWAHPRALNEVRLILEHVAANWLPGDLLVVHGDAAGQYLYYRPLTGTRAAGFIVHASADPCEPATMLRPLADARHVWLVFAHRLTSRPANERAIVRAFVEVVARPLSGYEVPGAAVYRYEPRVDGASPKAGDFLAARQTCFGIVTEPELRRSIGL